MFVPQDRGKRHCHYSSLCRLAIQNHQAAPAELFSPGRLMLISLFIEIIISCYMVWSRSSQEVVKVKNQARPLAQILYKERLVGWTMLTSHHHSQERSQQHRYHHHYHQYWLHHSHPNHHPTWKESHHFHFQSFPRDRASSCSVERLIAMHWQQIGIASIVFSTIIIILSNFALHPIHHHLTDKKTIW